MSESGRKLLVYGGGVSWTGVKGTDRHLAERLAEHLDVLWVDPPLSAARTRRRDDRDLPLWGRRLSAVAPGIVRLTRVVPPGVSRPGSHELGELLLRRSIKRAVAALGRRPYAFVVSRPETFVGIFPEAVGVYFATDDLAAGADLLGVPARRLRHAEQRNVRSADLLVGITPTLTARWAGTGKPVLVLPNGTDATTYAGIDRVAPAEVGLEGPVAGLVGNVNARIDLDVVEAVADRGVPLLIVGPVNPSLDRERFARLVARPTVVWTGSKRFEELPPFLRRMSVGLTPYVDSDFNHASFPLKTLEYLAAGLPVVSTPLAAAEVLASPDITVADGARAFADAVVDVVARPSSPEDVRRRRAKAAENDWGIRARTLLAAIHRAAEGRD